MMFEADSSVIFSENGDRQTLIEPRSPTNRQSWSLVPRSLIPSSGQFSSLIESGRSLTSRVQALLGDNRENEGQHRLLPENSDLSLENGQLLKNVSVAFERQEAINRTNAQLTKLNYLANVANYLKHRQVEKAVSTGQRQLSRMHNKILEQANTIDSLNTSVTSLEVDVQCTQDTCSRLDRSLRSQQDLLHTSIRENREAIEQQNSLLIKQQTIVENLLRQRIRHDFMVDAGLVATAIYLCNGILVDYPLQIVMTIVPNHKARKWIRQFTKVLLIIKVASMLKVVSVKCGLHNSVGSLVPYTREAWELAKGHFIQMLRINRHREEETLETEAKHSTNALDLC